MDTESISLRIWSTAARVLLVFVTYALLLVVTNGVVSTSGLVAAPAVPLPGPEPLRGLPVVALASAGLVSWLALRSHWLGSKLAVGIALTFFGVHTVLPELEALAAPGSFLRGESGAAGSWFGGAVFAATFAAAAVVILGRTGRVELEPRPYPGRATSIVADTVKVAAAAGLHGIVHAALGCRWGWYPAPEGVAFRGPLGFFCPEMKGVSGAAFAGGLELSRSSLWALIGLLLVRLLRRGPTETSLAVGLFFALAAPVQQLLPSPLMPGGWASGQRWALAASQLATGVALALWFSWQGPSFLAPRRGRHSASPSLDSASRDGRSAGGLIG
jgi:hypothetical protein